MAINPKDGGHLEVKREFFVEGVHCANCLRKIEKASEGFKGHRTSSFDMSRNVLSVWLEEDRWTTDYANTIEALGFQLTPLEFKSSTELARYEDHRFLMRLGVAAFCTSNIMILAFAIYAGATGEMAKVFNWAAFVLILPVVLYAAWPLYRSSYFDLRRGKISVDLPIALAIVSGFCISFWGMLTEGEVYFDSISALVFLLLASRYLLRRVQKKYLERSQFKALLDIHKAYRIHGSGVEEVRIEDVQKGDILRVFAGQMIPVDSKLFSEHATLEAALLTGEPRPIEKSTHDSLELGMRNLGSEIEIIATQSYEDSRLHRLLSEVEAATQLKSKRLQILDKVGQYFLTAVMISATLIISYFWTIDIEEGFRRSLAFVLVTCPCTFAFAVPLAYSLALKLSAKYGILVKHPRVFEKLQQVKNVVLDKTGTLTDGQFQVQSMSYVGEGERSFELSRIWNMVQHSEHPISRALLRFLDETCEMHNIGKPVVLKELPARALYAKFQEDVYELSAQKVLKNNKVIFSVQMGDKLRADTGKSLRQLQSRDLSLSVVSGDVPFNVEACVDKLGIDKISALGSVTPEEKYRLVQSKDNALMVGDGANDSLALAVADVGVAMQGSLVSSLKAADAYFISPGLSPLLNLFEISDAVAKTVRRNLMIAVFYNLIAGGLAIAGFIHPLLAAILMPLSSLTQLGSSLLLLRLELK